MNHFHHLLSFTVFKAKSLSDDQLQGKSPIVISVAETDNVKSPINGQTNIRPSLVLPADNFADLPSGMS